jgi:hypothetical protein
MTETMRNAAKLSGTVIYSEKSIFDVEFLSPYGFALFHESPCAMGLLTAWSLVRVRPGEPMLSGG